MTLLSHGAALIPGLVALWLKRLEKADDLLFLVFRQIAEAFDHVLRLTFVPFDGVLQSGKRARLTLGWKTAMETATRFNLN